MIYESNITGQRLPLIDFLNRRIENANGGITIIEYLDGGIWLSQAVEEADSADLSTETEASDYKEIARKGEELTAISGDFMVLVPTGVNLDEVRRLVDRYVIAGFEYTVTDTL